jgi:putative nucleotidyltransferase with HDIG domain
VIARAIEQQTRATLGRRAVSIGLTESTSTEARHVLIHQADLALYEAKRTKLTAVTYHPSIASRASESAHAPTHHQKALAAALARAVDAKDAGTRGHSETVAALTAAIGARLGIEGDDLERLRLAGLLHDVGKIGVPDALLQKAGALSVAEEEQMHEHASIGHSILNAAEMPIEAEWVLHHHERFDGKGYPTGLRGEEIPLESRIIAVADAFEAITGERPYRQCRTTDEALEELGRHADTQFDADCVDALAEAVERREVPTTGSAEDTDVTRFTSRFGTPKLASA